MTVLYKNFSTQQVRARNEAREMEVRRIELEERQAQGEKKRDTQLLMLMREMFSSIALYLNLQSPEGTDTAVAAAWGPDGSASVASHLSLKSSP